MTNHLISVKRNTCLHATHLKLDDLGGMGLVTFIVPADAASLFYRQQSSRILADLCIDEMTAWLASQPKQVAHKVSFV